MLDPKPKATFFIRLPVWVCLATLLAGCRDLDEERSMRALAYADVLDEVTLILRVERLAYPVLLEELSAVQIQLRREVSRWPTEQLLAVLRLYPDTPEARQAINAEGRRLDDLEAALLLEAEEELAKPDPPRPVDDAFDRDLRMVATFIPKERFNSLVRDGLDERTVLLLAEYDIERRTEGLSWHEIVGRLSSSLSEYTPVAAAYRRTNREIQERLEAVARYLDNLKDRDNPFSSEHLRE